MSETLALNEDLVGKHVDKWNVLEWIRHGEGDYDPAVSYGSSLPSGVQVFLREQLLELTLEQAEALLAQWGCTCAVAAVGYTAIFRDTRVVLHIGADGRVKRTNTFG